MSLIELLSARDPGTAVWHFPEHAIDMPLGRMWSIAVNLKTDLLARGVHPGGRIGILMDNCVEYPCTIVAAWLAGCTVVPLRAVRGARDANAQHLHKVQEDCRLCAVTIRNDEYSAEAGGWARDTGMPVIAVNAGLVAGGVEGPAASREGVRVDCPAVIQYSSGSTGHPKGVVVTHEMVLHQVASLDREFRRAGLDVFAMGSWLPFYHDMGLFIGILEPLYRGIDNVLCSPAYYMRRPDRWFRHMAEHKVDLTFTTNTAMAASLAAVSALAPGEVDLSLYHTLFGAEKISARVLRRCYEVFGTQGMRASQFLAGYGMAENALGATITLGGRVTVVNAEIDADGNVAVAASGAADGRVEYVSIGSPFTDVTLDIVSSDGRVQPELKLGEIRIEGPCVSPGYFHADGTPVQSGGIRGRQLYTNDLAFMCGGEVFFHSRVDDTVIVNGRNIVPDDVEEAAERLRFVRIGGTAFLAGEDADGVVRPTLIVECRLEPDAARVGEFRSTIVETVLRETGVMVPTVLFCRKGTVLRTSSGKKRRRVILGNLQSGSIDVVT